MSTESVESWKFIFEVGGLIVLALAFVFGGGAWMMSNVLNKRQGAQLREFQKKLADSERATEELRKQNLATESTLEQERIRRLRLEAIVAPRNVVLTRGIIERLERDAGTVLKIEYAAGDPEAHQFALRISATVVWADWRPGVPTQAKDTDALERAIGAFTGELREGVEIRGDKLPRGADFSKLPRNRAAEQLWAFLRANDIEANLYADAMFQDVGKPIVVRVWKKPTPDSKNAKLEGFDLMGFESSIPKTVREQHEAKEKGRLAENERLKKEWYPDGQ